MKKISSMTVAVLLALSLSCQAVGALHSVGQIVWNRGENSRIEVLGVGLPPVDATSILQSRKRAREAALYNAQAVLTKMINEMPVDSGKTIYELTAANDSGQEQLLGLIRRAKLVRQGENPDGTYFVFALNIFGAGGVAEVALSALEPFQPMGFPQPPTGSDEEALADVYSGVIIDARNLGFTAGLLPKIYDTGGRLIYDFRQVDKDSLIAKGMVDYITAAEGLSKAKNGYSRAGKKPLLVKAQKAIDNGCNIIVSEEDANKILVQNAKWGILSECAVVIAF